MVDRNENKQYWNSNTSFTNIVVPLLACEEVKDLVREAFYTRNYFVLAYSGILLGNKTRKVMFLPPQPIQKFIRKLRIWLEHPGLAEIAVLEKAARATKNLTLTFLDITFFSLRLQILVPHKPDRISMLCFKSKCLRVSYQHLEVAHERVLDKFVLSTGAAKELLQMRWTRVAYRHLKSDPICPPRARINMTFMRRIVSETDILAVYLD